MTSPLPAPPACPLYESLRRHRGHTSINANAGHQNEGDAASSDRVSRNLLFVLLGPLFPPQRFPFSQLMNISLQPVLIHSILDKIQLHPGWQVIIDDDKSCAWKVSQLHGAGVISNATVAWAASPSVAPMYRSDVCRLAQLYFHGGLYMDNDIELLVPLGLRLRPGVTCNVDYRINDANNAILAAPPRHKIVVYCLKIFDQIARGARMHDPKHNGYYGPAILGEAIRKLYGSYQSEVNRAAMISSGLQLLVERSYFSSNNKTLLTQPHLRGRRGPCGMNIVNESDGEVLAFSRVKKYSHPLEPCSGAHFWRLPDHTPDRLACIVERALGHPHFRRGRDENFTASPKMRLRR